MKNKNDQVKVKTKKVNQRNTIKENKDKMEEIPSL